LNDTNVENRLILEVTNEYRVACIQCESKNPPCDFLTFFLKRLRIVDQLFYKPIICYYLR